MNRYYRLVTSAVVLMFLIDIAFANDQVVKRLEVLAEAAPTVVENSLPVIAPPGRLTADWFRRKVSIREVAFDVRRTDSLVSPFAGEIAFHCYFRFARAKSEDELKDIPYGSDRLVGQCKVIYAYQGQKWVRKAGYCSSELEKDRPPRLMDGPDKGVGYYCVTLLPQE